MSKNKLYTNIGLLDIIGYRLPITGIVSILHRISGVFMFLAIPGVLYLLNLSLSSEAGYNLSREYLSSFHMKLIEIVLFGLCVQHSFGGLRFLLIDMHMCVDKKPARYSAIISLVLSISITTIFSVWLIYR